MVRTILRWSSLRVRPTRCRPVANRPSFRPILETLEDRVVPTITSLTTPSIVGYSQHAPPYDGSNVAYYAIGYNSYGNSVTAWVTNQTMQNVPGPNSLSYTIMTSSGTVSAPVLLVADQYDASGRFVSGVGFWGSNIVDVAVGANGPFAIAYLVDTWHYPDPNTTTPDSTTQTLYVQNFAANGTLLATTTVAQLVVNPVDSAHHYFLTNPKVGVDVNGGYTVAWENITEVDPIGGAHAWETDQLYVSRGGTQQLVASSYLDAGPNGFGDPSSFVGDRVEVPDIATNASGQSVVVWARMVNVGAPVPEYMALDAVYAQHVDATGALQGLPFAVSQNAHTYEPNAVPLVAMNDSGAFVVSWTYIPDYTIPDAQLPVTRGMYARLYKADGTSTNEFMVVASPHNETYQMQTYPFYYWVAKYYLFGFGNHPVGMDAAGNFVVGYGEDTTDQTPAPKDRVLVQAYNADGSPRGDPVAIAGDGTPFTANNGAIQLAMAPDGTFVFAGIGQPPPGYDETIVAFLLRLT